MLPNTVVALVDELEKISSVFDHATEIGGLGVLALPSIDNMLAKHKARKAGLVDAAGEPTKEGIEAKRFIKSKWHDPVEVGGLAALAVPSALHLLKKQGSAREYLAKKMVQALPIAANTKEKMETVPSQYKMFMLALNSGVPASQMIIED